MIVRCSIGLMTLATSWSILTGPSTAAQPAREVPLHDASAHDLASPNPLALLSKDSLKDFVEKPLFDPARSLPAVLPLVVQAAPVYTAPPESPPALHLLGVIEGQNAMAIARGPDMKTLMLHSGDHIGAWSVLVMPKGLRLSNGDRVSDYGMFTTGGGKGVTPTPMPSREPAWGAVPALGMTSPDERGRSERLQKRSF